MDWILFSAAEIEKGVIPPPGILVDYMTTDSKFNLQFNEIPQGDSYALQATIKAERYGIRDIGWHPFTLFEDEEALIAEAERLRPWLDRKTYKTRSRLCELKAEPQCVLLPSRKKRRGGLK